MLLLVAGTTLISSSTAQAQQSNSGNGLRISPVRTDLTIEPGKSRIIDVYVDNVTDSPTVLRGVTNDFTASNDESGKPQVLFDDGASAPSHGLRKYVAPISNFTLAPKERKDVKITISIPTGTAGGGYYGAVRFLPASGAGSEKSVSLSASVGSLVLVTVPGDVKTQLGLASFNINRPNGKASTFFTNGKSIEATMRFKNTGNVQTAPFGKINLKKSGKTIASYEINNTEPRGTVLPDSIRLFQQSFNDKTQSFGKYTVEGNFGYGNNGQLITTSSTFYVVPLLYILLAGGLIVLIALFVFIVPRMIKEHDRRLLRKIRGRS
jgi:hypothetical protein